jgi:hypothetical protein
MVKQKVARRRGRALGARRARVRSLKDNGPPSAAGRSRWWSSRWRSDSRETTTGRDGAEELNLTYARGRRRLELRKHLTGANNAL